MIISGGGREREKSSPARETVRRGSMEGFMTDWWSRVQTGVKDRL